MEIVIHREHSAPEQQAEEAEKSVHLNFNHNFLNNFTETVINCAKFCFPCALAYVARRFYVCFEM